jgi:hypothetical protein
MECRPNCNPERRTTDIPPDSSIPALTEHFAVKRAINLWTVPRHTAYNTLVQRIRSYKNNWPADAKHSPTALIEADFIKLVSEPTKKLLTLLFYTQINA